MSLMVETNHAHAILKFITYLNLNLTVHKLQHH